MTISIILENKGAEIFTAAPDMKVIDAVRVFAGDDYEAAYVPEMARVVLSRFDARSQHYEKRI